MLSAGWWELIYYHGAGTSSPYHEKQVEKSAPEPVGWMICFLLMTLGLVCILSLLVVHYYYINVMYFSWWYTFVILSCLDSNVYFICIFQGCIYYHMEIYTMRPCALVSCAPSQSIGLVLGCALFWCWVSLCVLFTNSLLEFYWLRLLLACLWPFYSFWTTRLGFL